MVMIELPESERLRAMPPPNFSAAFASPSLRWACKKRLRCLHPDATAAVGRRLSSLDDDCAAALSAKSSPSPPPQRQYGRARSAREEEEDDDADGEEPPARVPGQCVGIKDDGSLRIPAVAGRSLRSGFPGGGEKGKKKKKNRRVELWVSLSRDEIEEDFLWMTGAKPPRRFKRREKGAFDHVLVAVFPGAWMPNRISAARYRVPEPSESRKIAALEGS